MNDLVLQSPPFGGIRGLPSGDLGVAIRGFRGLPSGDLGGCHQGI